MNNICSIVNSYVSTPEFICPPPAPSFEDQVITTFFSNAPFILAAGVGSAMLLRSRVNRNVRLLANGMLMTASLATVGGAAFVSTTADAATRAVIGLSGLLYGANSINKDMQQTKKQEQEPTEKTESTLVINSNPTSTPTSTSSANIIYTNEADAGEHTLPSVILKVRSIMETPILLSMDLKGAARLMENKIEGLQLLLNEGYVEIAKLDESAKGMIDELFKDLRLFLTIYHAKIDAIRQDTGPTSYSSHVNTAALNKIKSNPWLNAALFFAHHLYSMVKPGLGGKEFQEATKECSWKSIFNLHCQKLEWIRDIELREDSNEHLIKYQNTLQPDLEQSGFVEKITDYPILPVLVS